MSDNSRKSQNSSKSKGSQDSKDEDKKRGGTATISSLLDSYEVEESKGYITREFQDYGYRLAAELNDLEHKSLYIRMAKHEPRGLLEKARSYVIDSNARSKAKLFMWRLKQLREERKAKAEKKKAGEQQGFDLG